MSRLRYNWDEARTHLRSRCDALCRFIDEFGAGRYRVDPERDNFQALCRSIVYQQLSGKAAGTIHGRFRALFDDQRPTARDTLDLGEAPLREAGLSRAKTLALLDLAAHVADGSLPDARRLGRMSDEAVIERLCAVRGIGPWTAQMHLIFHLGRPDVMPTTDLGVQRGVMNVHGLEEMPAPAEVDERTAHLAPFRSAAAWYFWRASEVTPPEPD